MRVLLDTHVLLWAMAAPERIGAAPRRTIEESDVLISAASIWEIGIKHAAGKLDIDARRVLDRIESVGFTLLPVTGEHAAHAAELPPLHRDPFDRMLVAQAKSEPLVLLTSDRTVAAYGDFVRLI